MGGAYNIIGNLKDLHNKALDPTDPYINNPVVREDVAECNVAADPKAANIVLTSGVPIVSVALDATHQVPLTKAFILSLEHSELEIEKLIFQMLNKIITQVPGGLDEFVKIYFLWDPLAAMLCCDPKLAEYKAAEVNINPTTYKTEIVPDAPANAYNVQVATKIINADKILDKLLSALQAKPPRPILVQHSGAQRDDTAVNSKMKDLSISDVSNKPNAIGSPCRLV